MDGSSVFVAVMPITTLIALFTGIALPFTAASRPGHAAAGRRAEGQAAENPALLTPPPPDTCTCPAPAPAPAAGPPRHAAGSSRSRSSRRQPDGSTTPATAGTGARPSSAPAASAASSSRPTPGAALPFFFFFFFFFFKKTRSRHKKHLPGRRPRHAVRPARAHGEHCPHGDNRCRRGYPAGVIPVPGDPPGPAGRLFFATRAAAEDHLHRREPGQPGLPHRPHRPSGSCAAPWPTPTPTAAAHPRSSSRPAAATRGRCGPREDNSPPPGPPRPPPRRPTRNR